jgi:cytochrome c
VAAGLTALSLAVGSFSHMPSAHAQAAPDPLVAKGRRLFLTCASCHAVGDTTVVRMGPNLKGVVGRKVAAFPGYAYSASLKAQSFDWDEERLDRWLQKPTQVAPDTTMAFIGLPAADDRRAVIAYLKTLR